MSCLAEEDLDPGTLSLQSLNFDKVRPLSELLGVSPVKARQERSLHTVKTLQVRIKIFFHLFPSICKGTSFTFFILFSVASLSILMSLLRFAKYSEDPILKGFRQSVGLPTRWTSVPGTEGWITLDPLEGDWRLAPIIRLTMKCS